MGNLAHLEQQLQALDVVLGQCRDVGLLAVPVGQRISLVDRLARACRLAQHGADLPAKRLPRVSILLLFNRNLQQIETHPCMCMCAERMCEIAALHIPQIACRMLNTLARRSPGSG